MRGPKGNWERKEGGSFPFLLHTGSQNEGSSFPRPQLLPYCVNCFFPGRLSLDSQEGDSGLDSGTERFPSLSEVSASRGEPH